MEKAKPLCSLPLQRQSIAERFQKDVSREEAPNMLLNDAAMGGSEKSPREAPLQASTAVADDATR